MKQTYNATSAFGTIMSSVLQKVEVFKDYEEMNDAILEKINTTTLENAKGRSEENTDGGDGESSSNESHRPPPKKRLLGKTVTMMMIMFLRGMIMMMIMIMTKTEMKKKIKRTEVNK